MLTCSKNSLVVLVNVFLKIKLSFGSHFVFLENPSLKFP